jgi:hypothetical protein
MTKFLATITVTAIVNDRRDAANIRDNLAECAENSPYPIRFSDPVLTVATDEDADKF